MANQQTINFAASSSSSSVLSMKKHDVFLSFRGEDTGSNFTSHLYDALIQKKVETCIDYRLEKGDEISPALIKDIEDSHASIVMFSKDYASSKWCLDEISKILECKRDRGQIVIPVFYNIDPSHIRKQTGSYKQAFAKHERDLKGNKDKVQKWRASLTEAANLAGWDSRTYRTESEFIKDIVKDVLHKLHHQYPIELKGMVGIEENYSQTESLLEIGSSEVRMIGLWGIGGIGKTTLATALYAKLSSQFEGHCFLANVREESEKYGVNVLRNKLFSELLEENVRLDAPTLESSFVMSRLRRKKVFIVLDDVATSEQLEDIIITDCLGPGSRIIVTTRDKHIFIQVDEIYEVKELNFHDSLQLSGLNAFREKHPKDGYEELSESVIAYCKGNPLALKVLGSRLRSRSKVAWESELRKLKNIPDVKIHNVLRLSYDDLDRTERDVFLDIACFLKGEHRDNVTSLLEACGFFATIGIEVLLDKALITISNVNRIEMHDLIQEMGREIVHQESIKDPGRRSRLWDPEEVYNVLKDNRGSEAVEGIVLDLSKIQDLHLSFDSFVNMRNLRFLKVFPGAGRDRCSNVYLPNGLKSMSDKLRYLQWHEYCHESLPSSFSAKMLVELSMPNSHIKKLWDGVQDLVNLREFDLRFSKRLIEMPDLSMATNLKEVCLTECESLRQVHPSILSLDKLEALDLHGCTQLESLETNVHLESLRFLRLSNCSTLKLFSVTSEKMMELWLDGTLLCELPSSIWHSGKLHRLNLVDCENLYSVGNKLIDDPGVGSLRTLFLSGCKQLNASSLSFMLDGMQSLSRLHLENCCNLQTLPDNIGLLSSLQYLLLSGSNVESLPTNIKNLPILKELTLDNCRKLVSLPELPLSLQELSASNCLSLETDFTQPLVLEHNISYSLKHGLQGRAEYVFLPGAQVPDRFIYHAKKTSIAIPLVPQSDLCGFIFCLILSQSVSNGERWYVDCFTYKHGKMVKRKGLFQGNIDLISDHVFLRYFDISDLPEMPKSGDNAFLRQIQKGGVYGHDNISFKFIIRYETGYVAIAGVKIKECGVYPVYASEYCHSIKQKELELGGTSKDIVELEPNTQSPKMQEPLPFSDEDINELQPRAMGIGVEGSNHENEDDQEVVHQNITASTQVQNGKEDLHENSSCDCFIGLLLKHLWRLVSTN